MTRNDLKTHFSFFILSYKFLNCRPWNPTAANIKKNIRING